MTVPAAGPLPGRPGDKDAEAVVGTGAAAGFERFSVAGFLPSTSGFRFGNAFPSQPAVEVDLRLGTIRIGNAADGLCGGMVFAAVDYWVHGSRPPTGSTPPASGTPLFRYLVRRLVDSWNLPVGPLTYYRLMSGLVPAGDRRVGPFTVRGLAWRMAAQEWPAIKADLRAGRLCPLGLVKLRSANPMELGKNHQVLCYAAEQAGTAVRLWVYDPNQPGTDDMVIALEVGRPERPIPVTMEPTAADPGAAPSAVLCFFRVPYTPKTPPS